MRKCLIVALAGLALVSGVYVSNSQAQGKTPAVPKQEGIALVEQGLISNNNLLYRV
jgi:hypothetical protein